MQPDSPGAFQHFEYSPPPRVHWSLLLLAWIGLAILFALLAPPQYQKLLNSLVVDAWAFRLGLWIRGLDPNAGSPFLCEVYVVVELAYALVSVRQNRSPIEQDIVAELGFTSFCLGIWTIYLIRSDLLKHYNRREPLGLELNGYLTYMFSFLYFQSQLYPIAKSKEREAEERRGAIVHG